MKTVKILLLIFSCITLVLVILLGLLGANSIQHITSMVDMSSQESWTDYLATFNIDINDVQEVLAFVEATEAEFAREIFSTGNNRAILYITAWVLTLLFAVTTTILAVLIMKVKSKVV